MNKRTTAESGANHCRTPLPPTAMVWSQGLTKTYRMGSEAIRAVDGVDLEIARGEFVAVMGPSGSGKSTLLHLIGALDRPETGVLAVNGQDLSRLTEKERDYYRQRGVGFIFQTFNLLPTLTALENVAYPMELAQVPHAARQERAEKLLAWVGLEKRLHHRPRHLSGGEMQRVAIARALANEPPLLLADEPTGNLDSRTAQEIMHLFRRINQELGTTIILVTHDPEVGRVADRIIKMRDGRLVDEPPSS